MRSFYITLILLTCLGIVNAQNSNQKSVIASIVKAHRNNATSSTSSTHLKSAVLKGRSLPMVMDSTYVFQSGVLSEKKTYTYNSDGLVIEELQTQWDSNIDKWFSNPSNKYTYTYDANGNELEKSYYSYDSYNDKWTINVRETSTYDANGNLLTYITETTEFGINGGLANSSKEIYTYDANGKPFDYLYQNWAAGDNVWIEIAKGIYSIDINGNPSQIIYSTPTGSAWEESNKMSFDYNGYNNLTDISGMTWDSNDLMWVNSWHETNTFDGSNNLTQTLGKEWDTLKAEWQNQFKISYTFDANNNQTHEYSYYWDVDKWSEPSIYENYFSDLVTTQITTQSVEGISLYPNPATSTLYVNQVVGTATVTIATINGLVVMTELINGNQIDISSLPKGLYIVSILSDNGTTVTKLIKE